MKTLLIIPGIIGTCIICTPAITATTVSSCTNASLPYLCNCLQKFPYTQYTCTKGSLCVASAASCTQSACGCTENAPTCPDECPSTSWTTVSTGRQTRCTSDGECEYQCTSGYYGRASTSCTKCPSNATCAGGSRSSYSCNAGYYSNNSACTKCPSPGTSSAGATLPTQCYVTTFSDTTGSGQYTTKCYYSTSVTL